MLNAMLPVRRAAALLALSLVACASAPQRWGEWVDPGLGRESKLLRTQKVLIACDTFDLSVRQLCQDGLLRELQARGVNPAVLSPGAPLLTGRDLEAQAATMAAALGAGTVFVLTLAPATPSTPSTGGSGFALGLGAFSAGSGGGVGLGLGAPFGGGWGGTGFSANGRVTEVRTGRTVWSSNFVGSASSDLAGQFRSLTGAILDSAQGSGLL